MRLEITGDDDSLPFAALGLVCCRDRDLGVLLGGELCDGGEDGVGAVGVDEVDERQEVASGRVTACGVVLQVAPTGEEYEFGMVGPASLLQVAGGEGQGLEGFSAAGECYPASGKPCSVMILGHGPDVGSAQDCVQVGDGAEFGGDGGGSGEADRGVCQSQPAVGFLGEVEAEAEELGQGKPGAVEAGHDVLWRRASGRWPERNHRP